MHTIYGKHVNSEFRIKIDPLDERLKQIVSMHISEVQYISTFNEFVKKNVHSIRSSLTNDRHLLHYSETDHTLTFEKCVSEKQSKRYLNQG